MHGAAGGAGARAERARPEQASLHSFHVGMAIAAVLLAVGGVIGALGIRNKAGGVAAEGCSAGQLIGTGRELAEGHRAGAA